MAIHELPTWPTVYIDEMHIGLAYLTGSLALLFSRIHRESLASPNRLTNESHSSSFVSGALTTYKLSASLLLFSSRIAPNDKRASILLMIAHS
jgi:hypothetical protein